MINFTIAELVEETKNFLNLNKLDFVGIHDIYHVLSGMPITQKGEFFQDTYELLLSNPPAESEYIYDLFIDNYSDYEEVTIEEIEEYKLLFLKLQESTYIEGTPVRQAISQLREVARLLN